MIEPAAEAYASRGEPCACSRSPANNRSSPQEVGTSVGVAVVGTTIAAIVGKVLPEGSWSPDFVATFAHAETVTFLVLAVLVGAVALYGSSTLTDSRTADEH